MTEQNTGEKKYQGIKIEKLPASKIKITGEVTETAFEHARKTAIEHLKAVTEIPGFRAGKVPESMLIKHVGEMNILERAAETAINDVYGDILADHDLRAIGMPAVSVTKIATGNPLGFSIETAVLPEIVLGNYKTIAKDAVKKIPDASTTVEPKEVDEVIEDVRQRIGTAMARGQNKDQDQSNAAAEENIAADKKPELPEFNDEFVKKFGNFENVADFRKKTEENILEHKKREVTEQRRAAIADGIIADAKFEVPDMIVESELDSMVGQFRADVERNGLTFDGYLTQLKKTEADIRKEWQESALRRAKLELVLKQIARNEKIKATEEEIKKDVDHIMSHHKNADRFKARMYVENIMTNQKVLEFLENQK